MFWNAPSADRFVGVGGTSYVGRLPGEVSARSAEPPEKTVEPAASVAIPLSSKSLAVIALSNGSPLKPARISTLFLSVSANLRSCPDHLVGTGMFPFLGTDFLRAFINAHFINWHRTA